MIIGFIKKIFDIVTDAIFSVLDIPAVPVELADAVNSLISYMEEGIGIVNFFLPLDKISPGIDLIIVLFALRHGYSIVMWVLRKIPVLGIE